MGYLIWYLIYYPYISNHRELPRFSKITSKRLDSSASSSSNFFVSKGAGDSKGCLMLDAFAPKSRPEDSCAAILLLDKNKDTTVRTKVTSSRILLEVTRNSVVASKYTAKFNKHHVRWQTMEPYKRAKYNDSINSIFDWCCIFTQLLK